jgi:hypothetical protein
MATSSAHGFFRAALNATLSISALPVPIVGFGSTDCQRCRSHLLGPIRPNLVTLLKV